MPEPVHVKIKIVYYQNVHKLYAQAYTQNMHVPGNSKHGLFSTENGLQKASLNRIFHLPLHPQLCHLCDNMDTVVKKIKKHIMQCI